MNITFSKLSFTFFSLPRNEQQLVLKRLYDFSPEVKFLFSTSLGFRGNPEVFIKKMMKETIEKVYRKGIPKEPNGKTINQILMNAKKAGVSHATLLNLEQLAYRGFMEFLHEYVGGPENFDDLACKQLNNYLELVLQIVDKSEKEKRIDELRFYLIEKYNMITDDKDEVFESVLGIPVNRPLRW